jgi:hypothetical protein
LPEAREVLLISPVFAAHSSQIANKQFWNSARERRIAGS